MPLQHIALANLWRWHNNLVFSARLRHNHLPKTAQWFQQWGDVTRSICITMQRQIKIMFWGGGVEGRGRKHALFRWCTHIIAGTILDTPLCDRKKETPSSKVWLSFNIFMEISPLPSPVLNCQCNLFQEWELSDAVTVRLLVVLFHFPFLPLPTPPNAARATHTRTKYRGDRIPSPNYRQTLNGSPVVDYSLISSESSRKITSNQMDHSLIKESLPGFLKPKCVLGTTSLINTLKNPEYDVLLLCKLTYTHTQPPPR